MKPKLFIIALLALLVASCTLVPLPEPEKEVGQLVTISANIPEETRVAYEDDTRKLAWETGDKLLLAGYDGTTYKGSEIFDWTGGKNFEGIEVPGATTYKAYYPGEIITLDDNGNMQPLAADFWQQTQNGNGATDHLRHKLLLFDKNANALDQTFSLALKSDILRFTLGGIPQDVGTLRSLIYTVETATGVFKSLQLNVNGVTFSSALDTLTAFLAFDPAVVKIAEDGEVKITLIGDKAYKWSNTIVSGMVYVAGKRYTANVSGTWTEIVNPLSYVAEYNVNQAGDGFVTNLTSCTGSGYFTWNNALNINISGYHLPSNQEWFGIVPQYVVKPYIYFNATTSYDNITENVIVQGDTITMTSDFRNSTIPTSYALRYKGTDMVSAWKYEYVKNSNDTHLKITSRIVAPSVTINDIANDAYWSTNTGNDVVRYFPASGYIKNDPTGIGDVNVGTHGYFWSSTESSNTDAWCMIFSNKNAQSSSDHHKIYRRYSVRLFTP